MHEDSIERKPGSPILEVGTVGFDKGRLVLAVQPLTFRPDIW